MKKIMTIVVLMAFTLTIDAQTEKLGDLNGDNDVNISDVMILVGIVLNGYDDFSVSSTSVTLPVGAATRLNIIGGYNSYEVVSANTAVAEASLNGTSITVKGIAPGETTLTVKDLKTFRSIDISVTIKIAPLQLYKDKMFLIPNKNSRNAIVSGCGTYEVESSDENVATATLLNNELNQILVTGVGEGTATLTVTDMISGQTAFIEVTVVAQLSLCPDRNHPHLIDLGLPSGMKWSCCNVGARTPERSGNFYAWGETEVKSFYSWSYYTYCNDGDKYSCHDLGSDISGTEYDVAHVVMGNNWQMPTIENCEEMFENTFYEWTYVSGFYGARFTGINGNNIFLPAAGIYSPTLSMSDYRGGYWTSNVNSSDPTTAHLFYFNSNNPSWIYMSNRCWGLNIRPVAYSLTTEEAVQ